jgi:Rps23 Pro-64 3,4-dihydroxylase Tpa1-like proline 4-hydroxylase
MHQFTDTDSIIFEKQKFIIIDHFLENEIAYECQNEILNADNKVWDRYDNYFEQKYTYRDKNNFPTKVNELFTYFTSDFFIEELNKLTKLTLINEQEKIFWGIHLFNDGDKLDIHVDAGRHLPTGFIKAVTIGIYLSYQWKEENGGHIEFWEGDSSNTENPEIYHCKEKILPIFNRCIIFENNDFSWHGAPDPCICKNNEKRIFLTLSYLTKESNPSFTNEKRKAYFIKRPDDPEDKEKDKMRLLRANPETCKHVYNLNNVNK